MQYLLVETPQWNRLGIISHLLGLAGVKPKERLKHHSQPRHVDPLMIGRFRSIVRDLHWLSTPVSVASSTGPNWSAA